MIFSYVGEYQLIMYNEKTIYSKGGKEIVTTTHAYGDAGYLKHGMKSKKIKKKNIAVQARNVGNKDQRC